MDRSKIGVEDINRVEHFQYLLVEISGQSNYQFHFFIKILPWGLIIIINNKIPLFMADYEFNILESLIDIILKNIIKNFQI